MTRGASRHARCEPMDRSKNKQEISGIKRCPLQEDRAEFTGLAWLLAGVQGVSRWAWMLAGGSCINSRDCK